MKVIEFRADNFKRLKVVQIKPDGDVVTISGANDAGKSSVVDGLFAAFQPRNMLKKIPEPVRKGERQAKLTVDIGEYLITRTIEPSGSTKLKVTKKATGASVKSPQTVIDGLLSSLCIDPSVFIHMKPADQVQTLIQLIDTEGFLEKNEELNHSWYEYRTEQGRMRDTAKGTLDALPKPELPAKETDPEEIKSELAQARYDTQARINLISKKSTSIKWIKELQNNIRNLEQDLKKEETDLATIENKLATMPPDPDMTALEQEYAESLGMAAKFDQMEAWQTASEKYNAADTQYETATKTLEQVKTAKETWLNEATLPVNGLGFDMSVPCVTFGGRPLEQASTSEQLKVGTAIAMAQNPELRVIRITDGNCLDSASFKMLTGMAQEHDFQLWIEKVDESGEIGFYIEDGQLAAIDGQPVK